MAQRLINSWFVIVHLKKERQLRQRLPSRYVEHRDFFLVRFFSFRTHRYWIQNCFKTEVKFHCKSPIKKFQSRDNQRKKKGSIVSGSEKKQEAQPLPVNTSINKTVKTFTPIFHQLGTQKLSCTFSRERIERRLFDGNFIGVLNRIFKTIVRSELQFVFTNLHFISLQTQCTTKICTFSLYLN